MERRTMLKGMAAFLGMGGSAHVANAATGFYVPAEEHRHELTFMQWPASRAVHSDPVFLEMLQETIARIANAISDFEPVVMLAAKNQHGLARQMLSNRVKLWDIPTEDLWCRDSGPLFAIDGSGKRLVQHIRFNGWGGKQRHRKDGRIAEHLARALDIPVRATGLSGEAGGVEQDGHGTLLAHESSWVNKNRNPGLSRAEVEKRLLAAFGAKQMIWSKGVYGEDITDYHIDSLARFTGRGRVLFNMPKRPDKQDPFHQAAAATLAATKAAGLKVDVIPEPEKRRVKSWDFVASYANYYVCNGAVIAAQFGDKETDQRAKDALRRHYPGRSIVMLNVDPLGEVGGGIHCATQQLPVA